VLGSKGLRLLDRTTRLALTAGALALRDAGLDPGPDTDSAGDDFGIALGSNSGSLTSRCDFYRGALEGGFRSVNPALFPNTVICSPAGQVAIRFGLRGCNATLSSGPGVALEAIGYAARAIETGRARRMLAGGAEELSPWVQRALDLTPFLAAAGPEETGAVCAPFDRRRRGTLLGEGAALFVLEEREAAVARGAPIYAEYRGGAATTDHRAFGRFNLRPGSGAAAIQRALDSAGVAPDAIDYVACGAASHLIGDAAECRALAAGLGRRPADIVASAPKSLLGESLSAGTAFQVAAALFALETQSVPPTAHCLEPDPRCGIDCVPERSRPRKVDAALVFATSPICQNAACVLTRAAG